MKDKVIEIKNLYAGYDGRMVLGNLNLEINTGEIVGLFGHNGAGKSTLLKILAGKQEKISGEVLVVGEVLYVPQNVRVFGNLTVKENILITSLKNAEHKNVPNLIYNIFPQLKMKENLLAGGLSGGQQQMVALARAILQKPDVLLLDEPSLGLSPKLVKEIFEVIRKINQEFGTTIVVAEHNILSLSEILHRKFTLEKGKIKV